MQSTPTPLKLMWHEELKEHKETTNLASAYNDVMGNVLDRHAPMKTRLVTARSSAPWITAEVQEAKQRRRAAERKWRTSQHPDDKHHYCNCIDIVRDTIIINKRKYYTDKINNCKNSKTLFSIFNEMNGKLETSPLPRDIPKEDLPDVFANYFINKVLDIRNGLDACSDQSNVFFDNHIDYSGPGMVSFREVTSEEVREIIRSSPPK